MSGAVGVPPVGTTVMVVRRVRVMVLVERVGGGVREMLGVKLGWKISVWCLVEGRVDAGSRIERLVIMVRVPSTGTGV